MLSFVALPSLKTSASYLSSVGQHADSVPHVSSVLQDDKDNTKDKDVEDGKCNDTADH